jgi:hypothetical protein
MTTTFEGTAKQNAETAIIHARPRFGLDWGGRAGKLVAVSSVLGQLQEFEPESLLALIVGNPGCEIVTEAAFEAYLGQDKRDEIVRAARANNVLMLLAPTRYTRKIRALHGLEKTDVRDAKILFEAGRKDRLHLSQAKLTSEMVQLDRTELTKRLVTTRRAKYEDDIARAAIALLPEASALPPRVAARLVKGKKKIKYDPLYRVVTLAETARYVVERGGNRRDYERWLGLSGHGYPSIMRSNLYHHGYHRDNLFVARWVFYQVARQLKARLNAETANSNATVA